MEQTAMTLEQLSALEERNEPQFGFEKILAPRRRPSDPLVIRRNLDVTTLRNIAFCHPIPEARAGAEEALRALQVAA